MEILYLDSSALIKLYVWERGSERMMELASEDADRSLAICAVTQVEFRSAIDRRRRERDLGEDEAELAVEIFNKHFRSEVFRCPVDDQTLDLASELVSRHSLRAYDAVQLAACMVLLTLGVRDSLTFVSADRRLLTAARSEGLAVVNPDEA